MQSQDGTQQQTDLTASADDAETSETYTREQAQKLVQKARSDALSEIGRLRKESEKAIKAAQEANLRLKHYEKERDEAELAAAQDEPEKITALQERQKRRAAEAELTEARAKLEEATSQLSEYSAKEAESGKLTLAQQMAAKHGVDEKVLSKIAKTTDGKAETIEEIAKVLPKVQGQQRQTLRPDSNRSHGGAAPTAFQTRKDFISGKITSEQYAEQMRTLGLQP